LVLQQPQQRRGGRDIKENVAKLIAGAAGVVLVKLQKEILSCDGPAPPRLRELWMLKLLYSRSHPSSAEEGRSACPQFTNS